MVVIGSNSIVIDPSMTPPIKEVDYDVCVFYLGNTVTMVDNFQITGVRQASLNR